MLIHRLAHQLKTSPDYAQIHNLLMAGSDATLGVAQSARPFIVAANFAFNPRPTVVVVAGEDASERFAQTLSAYVGRERVVRFPEREDIPWSDKEPDAHLIGKRCEALSRLSTGESCICVMSARALVRTVPPAEIQFYRPLNLAQGDEISFDTLIPQLLFMGYEGLGVSDRLASPGSFRHSGDVIDIWPAQSASPVRVEFFGDEIERIRRVVASTGQTIGDIAAVRMYPARELALSDKAIAHATRKLYNKAQDDRECAHGLQRLESHISFPQMDSYLPYLYSQVATPLNHVSSDALIVLVEPRSLFDDALRIYDDVSARAHEARVDFKEMFPGLYRDPRALDFGSQQRFTLLSMMRAGGTVDADLALQRPDVTGGDEKLVRQLRALQAARMTCVLCIPDRGARESIELTMSDAMLPFVETLQKDPANALTFGGVSGAERIKEHMQADKEATADTSSSQHDPTVFIPLERGLISVTDAPIPTGFIIPSAQLGVISVGDLAIRSTQAAKRRRMMHLDITDITFPFKPGDYVVHATHGIAYFAELVRQEVAGHERDYFLLEYAHGDKLFVPLEQVDKLTRYIGPDGDSPRLTRLNTSDWSRATTKARASAKKLAFDLVDLYTRRSTIQGYSYGIDSAWQHEMEETFPYEETPDQLRAIADIKADMESDKPMDRLLCGDVGFGKTEVALRAAFKAVQDGKQVMVLCPTTILAQQHYTTFFERFAPFDVEVEVLSRFRTPAQQRRALEGFAAGEVPVLIGTHRLLSNDVNPHDLGLVIIDEEQRFGVQHKEQLKTLREQVDVLTLSATPIPRTMQMAMSGVRDMSLIKTPPRNRLPVQVHVGEWDEDAVSAAIRLELARDGQVYYVSNRVKTIDDACTRVMSAAPEARVGVAHGQMSEKELEDVMNKFINGHIDVLIATTIIESGIDNPHTNTLIIEDSQRLGLAQLYQLKGRVGRSRTQAYAYFMFPVGETLTQQATDRLLALEEFQDLGSGMDIAMRDLEIRGAGSLMGAEQSGNLSSVGFDLFTQMLGEAVAEARGEGETQISEVTVNLSVDYYLDESYIPMADERVRAYRRLASATSLSQLDQLETDLEQRYGALPQAGRNLLDRERIKIRSRRLGVTSVALVNGKFIFQNLVITPELKSKFALKGGIYYPTSHKLTYPYKKGDDDLVMGALAILEEVGGGDEVEED